MLSAADLDYALENAWQDWRQLRQVEIKYPNLRKSEEWLKQKADAYAVVLELMEAANG